MNSSRNCDRPAASIPRAVSGRSPHTSPPGSGATSRLGLGTGPVLQFPLKTKSHVDLVCELKHRIVESRSASTSGRPPSPLSIEATAAMSYRLRPSARAGQWQWIPHRLVQETKSDGSVSQADRSQKDPASGTEEGRSCFRRLRGSVRTLSFPTAKRPSIFFRPRRAPLPLAFLRKVLDTMPARRSFRTTV